MVRIIFILLSAVVITPSRLMAQDDMYFTPTQEMVKENKKAREKAREKARQAQAIGISQYDYYSGINKTDDEYNRRNVKTKGNNPYSIADSTLYSTDSIASDIIEFSIGDGTYPEAVKTDTVYKYIVIDDDDYRYCRRISWFDDFYWWSSFYSPYSCIHPLRWYSRYYYMWNDPWYWGWPYYSWYDPWFAYGWYDPWFTYGWYDPWYYHHPIYISSGGRPSGNGGQRYYAGTRNHGFNRGVNTKPDNSYAIAKRNGDGTSRHRGVGYRYNGNAASRYNNDSYRSSQSNFPSGNASYNSGNYRGASSGSFNSGSSGSFGGGHSSGFSGGSRSGGSFGNGRRR